MLFRVGEAWQLQTLLEGTFTALSHKPITHKRFIGVLIFICIDGMKGSCDSERNVYPLKTSADVSFRRRGPSCKNSLILKSCFITIVTIWNIVQSFRNCIELLSI